MDNPEFYNRIAETFSKKAPLRFVILLWGDKSSLVTSGRKTPVYCYSDIKNLGHERRARFGAGSNDAGKLWIYFFYLVFLGSVLTNEIK